MYNQISKALHSSLTPERPIYAQVNFECEEGGPGNGIKTF